MYVEILPGFPVQNSEFAVFDLAISLLVVGCKWAPEGGEIGLLSLGSEAGHFKPTCIER